MYYIDVWFSRVSSESNASDDASRLVFEPWLRLGFVVDELGSCWSLSQGETEIWNVACFARQVGVVRVFQ